MQRIWHIKVMNEKNDWLKLCLDMMYEYIPKDFDTQENYNKFQEVCDHFISISTALSARKKDKRNINQIMIDDDEDIVKTAEVLKRSARQNFEFVKQLLIEKGLYAETH